MIMTYLYAIVLSMSATNHSPYHKSHGVVVCLPVCLVPGLLGTKQAKIIAQEPLITNCARAGCA